MKIYIASDHAGFELKEKIYNYLLTEKTLNKNLSIENLGPSDLASVDYPDYADQVCKKIESDSNAFGILICGSGQGMAMRANKYSYIRAALVYADDLATLSREHNNANVICLGSRFCSPENAQKWVKLFLETPFSEGRHSQRVAKVSKPVLE